MILQMPLCFPLSKMSWDLVLAGRMEKLIEAGESRKRLYIFFLQNVIIITRKRSPEVQADSSIVQESAQNAYEKAVADYLFSRKQYGRAVQRYKGLVEAEENKKRRGILVRSLSEPGCSLCPDVPVP